MQALPLNFEGLLAASSYGLVPATFSIPATMSPASAPAQLQLNPFAAILACQEQAQHALLPKIPTIPIADLYNLADLLPQNLEPVADYSDPFAVLPETFPVLDNSFLENHPADLASDEAPTWESPSLTDGSIDPRALFGGSPELAPWIPSPRQANAEFELDEEQTGEQEDLDIEYAPDPSNYAMDIFEFGTELCNSMQFPSRVSSSESTVVNSPTHHPIKMEHEPEDDEVQIKLESDTEPRAARSKKPARKSRSPTPPKSKSQSPRSKSVSPKRSHDSPQPPRRRSNNLCTTCGAKFSSSGHLSRHRYIHLADGEKPHACPIEGCGRRFSRKDNLGVHVRAHAKSPKLGRKSEEREK